MLNAATYDFTLAGYLAWLSSLDGLSARTDGDGYGQLVAEKGPDADRAFLCGITTPGSPQSGCMVVQCGAAQLFFEAHDKPTPLSAPVGYNRWDVMARWAALSGALLAPSQWAPQPGDIVFLFTAPNHQHWVSLIASTDKTGADWSTIEGGQVDQGYQCVKAESRVFVKTPAWLETHSGHGVVQIVRMRTLIESP